MNDTREIKSFVRRGLITPGQKKALNNHWDQFGIDIAEYTEKTNAFFKSPHHKKILDIGFGYGDSLITQATQEPNHLFIGVEVHRPGLGHCLGEIYQQQLSNLRLIHHDVMELLPKIAENTFDCVQLFFPDPWPKRRHHKRRLLNEPFLKRCVPVIKTGGILHVATDWQHYANQILTVLTAQDQLENTAENYAPRPAHRPLTKFEQRGQRLGHAIYDLVFVKCES